MQAHRLGVGRGDRTPLQQPASSTSSIWLCRCPRLQHAAPQTPLLPFTASHPPASALPLAGGSQRGRQTMRGGIPQGTGLLYAGKMYMPNVLCPEPEHFLSPS